jgi:hypothetical protein
MGGGVQKMKFRTEKDDPFLQTPEMQVILRAMAKVREGQEHNEKCHFCHKDLHVESWGPDDDYPPNSFRFSCECGKSNGSFLGL